MSRFNSQQYHCTSIIHQEALCGKFLKCNEIMKLVVKIVNSIRAHALQRRLFRTLIDELELDLFEQNGYF